jgi:predicted metal-binding protein
VVIVAKNVRGDDADYASYASKNEFRTVRPEMIQKEPIETLIQEFGFSEYRWIKPEQILISHWVRLKCLYGCGETGRPACPPNLPSIHDCRELIQEYTDILIFRFEKDVIYQDYPRKWAQGLTQKLLELEKRIFLAGYYKVFLLNASSCNLCHECKADRKSCKHPLLLRPCPEALGIDVFTTVRNLHYPIEVLQEDSKVMNRYAFILVQ